MNTPPVLSELSATNRSFAPTGVRGKGRKNVARGTTFRFTLSEPAKVRFVFERRKGGRRAGGKCLAPTRARRHRRACTRYVPVGSTSVSSAVLHNSVAFSGRVKGRPLPVGSYRAVLVATDAYGMRSHPAKVGFRIVRP